jgi:hypothetical protein
LASSQSGGRPSAAMTASVRSGSVQAATFVSAGASIAMAKNGAAAERLSLRPTRRAASRARSARACRRSSALCARNPPVPGGSRRGLSRNPAQGTRRTRTGRSTRAGPGIWGCRSIPETSWHSARAPQAGRQTDAPTSQAELIRRPRLVRPTKPSVRRAPSASPLSGGRGARSSSSRPPARRVRRPQDRPREPARPRRRVCRRRRAGPRFVVAAGRRVWCVRLS